MAISSTNKRHLSLLYLPCHDAAHHVVLQSQNFRIFNTCCCQYAKRIPKLFLEFCLLLFFSFSPQFYVDPSLERNQFTWEISLSTVELKGYDKTIEFIICILTSASFLESKMTKI